MSFVFYDIETTGTNTSFDQILQFAAIKTDHDLRELERFEIRCRLLPYVVPSPGAMRVTGITVDQLTDSSLPSHYQMVCTINAKLKEWSPAIFMGHNSLSFDEHLLRQSFYKSLYPPYLTNTNGNCRSDSLRIIQASNHYVPGILSVPMDETGKQTFKLDRLAPVNNFNQSSFHDAMGDVEAMMHMCRLVAERTEDHWSNFVRFAQKAAILNFSEEEEVFVLSDFYCSRAYTWMVTTIGVNTQNSSELIVFDLSVDPKHLVSLSDDDLAVRLANYPKPVRSMRANASPCVLSLEDTPAHLRTHMPEIGELKRRAAHLKRDKAFAQRLIAAFIGSRRARVRSNHVEEQIYDNFTGNEDQTVMDRFHLTDWRDRANLLTQLTDERIKLLGQRLIFVEAPDALSAQDRSIHGIDIARRLMAPEGSVPWLTLPKSISDTNNLISGSSGSKATLLRDLRDYLIQRTAQAGAVLSS
jgi:exodeoxyribonuclease I